MSRSQSLEKFIDRFAKKISHIYLNSCADVEDYIQAGHLKLAEISGDKREARNFLAYAIISIARAMRESAANSTCAVSAPPRIKARIHKIAMLAAVGQTEQEICDELCIGIQELISLRLLIDYESLSDLFREPLGDCEQFSFIDDILSTEGLTEEERDLVETQLCAAHDCVDMSRNQKYRKLQKIRNKLARSGYGS